MATIPTTRGTEDETPSQRVLLAGTSIAAGIIHAAVVPEHLDEAWIFGIFFLLAACFQLVWAVPAFVRPTATVFAAGVAANGALIATWLVSRTSGLPIGPEPWMPEPAGVLDVGATALELLIVASSVAIVRRRAVR